MAELPTSAADFYEQLRDGRPLASDVVGHVCSSFAEDQHLDYKSGALTGVPRGNDSVRRGRDRFIEAVLALTNAEGGVLLLGVDRDRKIDGIQTLDARRWVDDVLQFYRSRMSEWPSVRCTETAGGPVAAVVVTPSADPVPHRDGRILLRRGQENAEAEGYLLRLLMTGGWRGPSMDLQCVVSAGQRREMRPPPGMDGGHVPSIALKLHLTFTNLSLAWSGRIKGGLVLHRFWERGEVAAPAGPVNARVDHLPYVDRVGHWVNLQRRWKTEYVPFNFPPSMSPLLDEHLENVTGGVVPTEEPWGASVAAFLVAENTAPQWWQVTLEGHDGDPEVASVAAHRRPRVGWWKRS